MPRKDVSGSGGASSGRVALMSTCVLALTALKQRHNFYPLPGDIDMRSPYIPSPPMELLETSIVCVP